MVITQRVKHLVDAMTRNPHQVTLVAHDNITPAKPLKLRNGWTQRHQGDRERARRMRQLAAQAK